MTIIILVSLIILSFTISADDIPTPPHRFKGFVIDETGELYQGIINITAKLNGISYDTTADNGKYGFYN